MFREEGKELSDAFDKQIEKNRISQTVCTTPRNPNSDLSKNQTTFGELIVKLFKLSLLVAATAGAISTASLLAFVV